MSREKRKISKTEIYHIMIRGNNKQNIFLNDADRNMMCSILMYCKQKDSFFLHSYCLMNNHCHFLIETTKKNISDIMHRIQMRYAKYFNRKYQRIGSLFQGRFKSEPVEDNNYFENVINYIHLNPIKAGYVKRLQDFKWSSYIKYMSYSKDDKLVDKIKAISLIGIENIVDIDYKKINPECEESILEDRPFSWVTDDFVANQVIILFQISPTSVVRKSLSFISKCIKRLLKINNVTRYQISRVIGVSKYLVYKLAGT